MSATSPPISARQRDEDRLTELLAQGVNPAHDQECLSLVYQHLYDNLRPMLVKKHGADMDGRRASKQFTDMLNDFFVRVMEKARDKQAKQPQLVALYSTRELKNYVSRALLNLLIGHSRRRKSRANAAQEMEYLFRDFEVYFKHDCPDIDFDAALEQFDRWDTNGGEQERQWAAVLRGRYIDGLENEEIQSHLDISPATFHRRHNTALAELRKLLSM
ncbi:MAG: ECF-type sigma factor [Planctomycetota bacterium]|nr:ECF-type sigma factor [Planctomycetota bacterium]